MANQQTLKASFGSRFGDKSPTVSRKMIIAAILSVALLAFEIFNFDTTQYALRDLLGDVRFMGILWATILAIAFCAIDFAGLVRIVTPQRGQRRAQGRLVPHWRLVPGHVGQRHHDMVGCVTDACLNHDFGNEVLSREQLLRYVPIFVAALVWLTTNPVHRRLFGGRGRSAGPATPENQWQWQAVCGPSVRSPVPANASSNRPRRPRPREDRQLPSPRRPSTSAHRRCCHRPHTPTVTYEPVDDPVMARPTPPPTPTPRATIRAFASGRPMPGGSRVPSPGMQAQSHQPQPVVGLDSSLK